MKGVLCNNREGLGMKGDLSIELCLVRRERACGTRPAVTPRATRLLTLGWLLIPVEGLTQTGSKQSLIGTELSSKEILGEYRVSNLSQFQHGETPPEVFWLKKAG
ncbi:hypothetical protein BY996DRAFT_6427075 [Phakopsora pachyrhizi]|nr:hypothetical protein BY996DRAFT_6427075 [Phakopsora pachyrhizi]